MEAVLGDGLSSELGCWMEVCVARVTIRNAGEFNGFLKPNVRLFSEPLRFAVGELVLPWGFTPTIDGPYARSARDGVWALYADNGWLDSTDQLGWQCSEEFCNTIPPKADIARRYCHVRLVPILLQKSPKKKGAVGAEL